MNRRGYGPSDVSARCVPPADGGSGCRGGYAPRTAGLIPGVPENEPVGV
jgi:hypothetical protein